MKILLHACCGPCTLFPARTLMEEGLLPTAFFYNPNIHLFREFERRVEAMEAVASALSLPVIWDGTGYGLETWMEKVGMAPSRARCPDCYSLRLVQTARTAAENGFDAFTTTLLYSRHQRHESIRDAGETASTRYGVPFLYRDFRRGWEQGIEAAKTLGIYRQPYCGCILSEAERYSSRAGRLRKRFETSGGTK